MMAMYWSLAQPPTHQLQNHLGLGLFCAVILGVGSVIVVLCSILGGGSDVIGREPGKATGRKLDARHLIGLGVAGDKRPRDLDALPV